MWYLCGTPVKAIFDHTNLTRMALPPKFGFGALQRLPYGPLNFPWLIWVHLRYLCPIWGPVLLKFQAVFESCGDWWLFPLGFWHRTHLFLLVKRNLEKYWRLWEGLKTSFWSETVLKCAPFRTIFERRLPLRKLLYFRLLSSLKDDLKR